MWPQALTATFIRNVYHCWDLSECKHWHCDEKVKHQSHAWIYMVSRISPTPEFSTEDTNLNKQHDKPQQLKHTSWSIPEVLTFRNQCCLQLKPVSYKNQSGYLAWPAHASAVLDILRHDLSYWINYLHAISYNTQSLNLHWIHFSLISIVSPNKKVTCSKIQHKSYCKFTLLTWQEPCQTPCIVCNIQ